jgi:hypothetical protein
MLTIGLRSLLADQTGLAIAKFFAFLVTKTHKATDARRLGVLRTEATTSVASGPKASNSSISFPTLGIVSDPRRRRVKRQ